MKISENGTQYLLFASIPMSHRIQRFRKVAILMEEKLNGYACSTGPNEYVTESWSENRKKEKNKLEMC